MLEEKLANLSVCTVPSEKAHCKIEFSPCVEKDDIMNISARDVLSGTEKFAFTADKKDVANAYFLFPKSSELGSGSFVKATDDNIFPAELINSLNKKIASLEDEVQSLTMKTSLIVPTKCAEYTDADKSCAATRIQKLVRGHISRMCVSRIISKKNLSTMSPVKGTRIGGSGWYTQNMAYFYFCRDPRSFDFVALCGPISETEYNKAIMQAKGRSRFISVDSSAILASHAHGDLLLETIVGLKSSHYASPLGSPPVNRRRSRTNSDGRINIQGVAFQNDDVIKDLDNKIVSLQKELEAAHAANRTLRRKLSNHEIMTAEVITMGDKSRKALKIQTLIRKFIAGLRVARILVLRYAATDREIALPGTKKGSTGWYMCRNLYYYSVLIDGKLQKLCSPMSKLDYEKVYQTSRLKNRARLPLQVSGVCAVRNEIYRLRAKVAQLDSYQEKIMFMQGEIKNLEEKIVYFDHKFNVRPVRDLEILSDSPNVCKGIVKFQGLVRCKLAVRRCNKIKIYQEAKRMAILLAVDGTVQGESGWYINPEGIVLFVRHPMNDVSVTLIFIDCRRNELFRGRTR